ncbi:MAG: hypothetical protein ACYS29_06685 [Planctomycetota bacterium]|jgi:hypothetical protein
MKFNKLVIGIVAGFIVAVIVYLIIGRHPQYSVRISSSQDTGQQVVIKDQELADRTRNPDGILFLSVEGLVMQYEGKLAVEVRPDDVPDWFRQDDVEAVNGTFKGRIQLGSREWPIKGGERYVLRVSAGEAKATANILVIEQPIDINERIKQLLVSVVAGLIVLGITRMIGTRKQSGG